MPALLQILFLLLSLCVRDLKLACLQKKLFFRLCNKEGIDLNYKLSKFHFGIKDQVGLVSMMFHDDYDEYG